MLLHTMYSDADYNFDFNNEVIAKLKHITSKCTNSSDPHDIVTDKGTTISYSWDDDNTYISVGGDKASVHSAVLYLDPHNEMEWH